MGQFFGGVRCFVKVREEILAIDPEFTVVCSVTWPLDGSESGGDLVLRSFSSIALRIPYCAQFHT